MIALVVKLVVGLVRLVLIVVWEVFRALLPFGLGRLLPTTLKDDAPDPDEPAPHRAGERRDPLEAPLASQLTTAQLLRLQGRVDGLVLQVAADPRLVRLDTMVAELQHALLPALRERLLGGTEDARALLQEHDRLSALVRYLEHMLRQRLSEDIHYLGDADAAADACFAPLLEFTRSEGIPFSTRTPVVLHGDWGLSVDLSFRHASIAPVRLPRDFRRSVYLWPALAHEVAHDFYFSVEGLEDALYERLELPFGLMVPEQPSGYAGFDPRLLYGPWLPEVFADLVGLLQMGPAYAIAMARLFAEPEQPERVRAASQQDGYIETHPPAELRIQIAALVLDRLGRNAEAGALLERWNLDHGLTAGYYLPSGSGSWVRVPPEFLLAPGRELVRVLLDERWPTLSGYTLMGIPGFAYLHAEHARVQTLMAGLTRGQPVQADARLIIAAAVLAVESGADEAFVLDGMRRSIVGIGTGEHRVGGRSAGALGAGAHGGRKGATVVPVEGLPIGQAVIATLTDREALVEAIVLGATLRRKV